MKHFIIRFCAAIAFGLVCAFGALAIADVNADQIRKRHCEDYQIAWQARDAALQDAEALRHLLWHTQHGSVTPEVQADINRYLDGWSPVSWEEQYRLNAMKPGELR